MPLGKRYKQLSGARNLRRIRQKHQNDDERPLLDSDGDSLVSEEDTHSLSVEDGGVQQHPAAAPSVNSRAAGAAMASMQAAALAASVAAPQPGGKQKREHFTGVVSIVMV